MDPRYFDTLARTLATGHSRRKVLRVVAAGAADTAAPGKLFFDES